jgi:hypothetical protein
MVIVNQGARSDVLTSVTSNVATAVRITDDTSAAATGSATPEPSDSASASPTATPSDTPSGSDTASASGSAAATATPTPTETTEPNAPIAIPPSSYVSFTGDGPRVELTGLTTKLYPAQTLSVTLRFQDAGTVTMTIAVSSPEIELSPAPTVSVDPGGESEG